MPAPATIGVLLAFLLTEHVVSAGRCEDISSYYHDAGCCEGQQQQSPGGGGNVTSILNLGGMDALLQSTAPSGVTRSVFVGNVFGDEGNADAAEGRRRLQSTSSSEYPYPVLSASCEPCNVTSGKGCFVPTSNGIYVGTAQPCPDRTFRGQTEVECTSTCETEFIQGCMAFKTSVGAFDPYGECRAEVDAGAIPQCDAACRNTLAMQALSARNDSLLMFGTSKGRYAIPIPYPGARMVVYCDGDARVLCGAEHHRAMAVVNAEEGDVLTPVEKELLADQRELRVMFQSARVRSLSEDRTQIVPLDADCDWTTASQIIDVYSTSMQAPFEIPNLTDMQPPLVVELELCPSVQLTLKNNDGFCTKSEAARSSLETDSSSAPATARQVFWNPSDFACTRAELATPLTLPFSQRRLVSYVTDASTSNMMLTIDTFSPRLLEGMRVHLQEEEAAAAETSPSYMFTLNALRCSADGRSCRQEEEFQTPHAVLLQKRLSYVDVRNASSIRSEWLAQGLLVAPLSLSVRASRAVNYQIRKVEWQTDGLSNYSYPPRRSLVYVANVMTPVGTDECDFAQDGVCDDAQPVSERRCLPNQDLSDCTGGVALGRSVTVLKRTPTVGLEHKTRDLTSVLAPFPGEDGAPEHAVRVYGDGLPFTLTEEFRAGGEDPRIGSVSLSCYDPLTCKPCDLALTTRPDDLDPQGFAELCGTLHLDGQTYDGTAASSSKEYFEFDTCPSSCEVGFLQCVADPAGDYTFCRNELNSLRKVTAGIGDLSTCLPYCKDTPAMRAAFRPGRDVITSFYECDAAPLRNFECTPECEEEFARCMSFQDEIFHFSYDQCKRERRQGAEPIRYMCDTPMCENGPIANAAFRARMSHVSWPEDGRRCQEVAPIQGMAAVTTRTRTQFTGSVSSRLETGITTADQLSAVAGTNRVLAAVDGSGRRRQLRSLQDAGADSVITVQQGWALLQEQSRTMGRGISLCLQCLRPYVDESVLQFFREGCPNTALEGDSFLGILAFLTQLVAGTSQDWEGNAVFDVQLACRDSAYADAFLSRIEGSSRRQLQHGRGLASTLTCPSSGSRYCHPGEVTVQVVDSPHGGGKRRRERPLWSVRVGDRIRTPAGEEPVTGFVHRDPRVWSAYVELSVEGGRTLSISPNHRLPVRAAPGASPSLADPWDVRAGQYVAVASETAEEEEEEWLAVTAVRETIQRGAYHIVTPSGSYYANGIAASTYVSLVPHWTWRVFLDGYVTARYYVGWPVTPEGESAVPLFWSFGVLDALGVPGDTQRRLLWPVHVAAVFGTELVASLLRVSLTMGTALAALCAVVSWPRPWPFLACKAVKSSGSVPEMPWGQQHR